MKEARRVPVDRVVFPKTRTSIRFQTTSYTRPLKPEMKKRIRGIPDLSPLVSLTSTSAFLGSRYEREKGILRGLRGA
jgi:hypothetical protein